MTILFNKKFLNQQKKDHCILSNSVFTHNIMNAGYFTILPDVNHSSQIFNKCSKCKRGFTVQITKGTIVIAQRKNM